MITQAHKNNLKNLDPIELGKIRVAHESNKREAFDGMRAYHLSEINHKKDAIDILKTILTTEAIIFGGLVAGISKGVIHVSDMILLGLSITGISCFSVISIVWTTILKINQDNKRYRSYKNEYLKERELIGLDDDLKAIGHESHWNQKIDENKTGYSYTNIILVWLGISVILVAIFGAVVVNLAANKIG
jgi:hypothetical protein